MHHRSRVFLIALLLASFAFVGCSGLVAGNNGNPPPPSTLDITNVQAASITTSSSQVVWTTNVPANSSVDYGTTPAYGGSTPVDSGMVTSHQMTLSGLAAGTTYYYQVNSTDSKGNHGHGGNKFNTTGFSLSGTINPAKGGSGSTLTLSGAASATTTADNSGNYILAGLPNGSYMVTPKQTGYVFTPGNQSATVNGTNVSGVNFTATSQTFSISGTISPVAGGSGATVTLSGAASATTTANSSGAYTLTGLASGAYTITPSNAGYTFTPLNQNVTVSTMNVTGVNFTDNAAAVAPTITTQPASQTVTAGQTASFTVAATGTAPLSYQWNKNGTAITGATSSTYTTPATTNSDSGAQFTVVVSNTVGSVTSSPATLTVNSSGSIINVLNFGATGNGSTNDTAAINSAIAALQPGDTLLFPCTTNSTYLVTSQLTINVSSVTVDGSSCAILHNTSSGTVMVIGGSGNGNPNYGSAVALSTTANELAASFTTVSSLGVAAGDYVRLQQGGKDSSNGSGDTGCDPSGCRGEALKVASVSGNTITVTTALHDTYNPSVNNATAQKILSPVTGLTVKNITFDGNGSNVYGLAVAGVAESTLTGVTSKNVRGSALLNRGDFNVAWSNISVTGAGSAQCGSAVWFENQGNLSVNGMTVSNENPGASGTGCLYNGAFGFELIASANSTISNLTVDASGAYGRPFKTTAARYNTFNSPTVKNGVQNYNGISLEYYSSHNTYNNCVVTNNGAGAGTGNGNAGINTFGNFNEYNAFNSCTVTGNGNVQVLVNDFDALRLGQDSNNTFSGGTFTGTNSVTPVIEIGGANVYVKGATISGPGSSGIQLDSSYGTNGCINNNTFTAGTGMGGAINSGSGTNIGLGNILSGLSSNLTAGTCGPSSAVSILPTTATVASGGTQQFTATVTGSTNTAVTWSATAGSVSSSGLFTAPTVSTNTTVTVTATSQALTSQSASATVTVIPSAPPNTFGYAVQGVNVGTTMSNSVLATRNQMVGQNGTVTSMSVFIASPVSASPNNQFQVAIYADNSGTPGALIASSVSQAIVPDAWNTVSISAPVTANAYYWLAYNTNGLTANANNLRYDVGGTVSMWITSEPFGTWPATYGPLGGTDSSKTSMYATLQ